MKFGPWKWIIPLGSVVLLLGGLVLTAPKHPSALFRVIDAAGNPVADAIIQAEGLRTKAGPYASGWYGWRTEEHGIPNDPVHTDRDGYALVPYPKFVVEQLETGTVHVFVQHPDFVSERPERVVATAPPAGAPWQIRAEDLWNRLRHQQLIARPDPIMLQKGSILKVAIAAGAGAPKGSRLFAQVSGLEFRDTNTWEQAGPAAILTRRLAAGAHTVRAVQVGADRSVWFSEVISITAVTGQTNELALNFQRGITVRGHLDAAVPRPVSNGRVVAQVWPSGHNPKDEPPEWHNWAKVADDGTFELPFLPAGELEVVALVDGFVSTNGPGKFQMRYPQLHRVGTNDLAITIGMEPTARLHVRVLDDQGKPLAGATVATWPNVRYGEWGATILMSDCYNSVDGILAPPDPKSAFGSQSVRDFHGVTDRNGLAVLPNLPVSVREFDVEHPRFALAPVSLAGGEKRRGANVTLLPGQTNHVSVQLEPREQSRIAHY